MGAGQFANAVYIRRRVYKLKNATQRTGYGLLECRRVNGQPRQKTILNLGQDFDIAEADWPTVTKRVELALHGQRALPLEDEKIERAVDEIVRRLREKDYDVDAGRDDRDAIITDAVHHPDSRTVGGERVCLQALEQLGFAALLRALGMREDAIRMALVLVVGRMLSPGSEAHTYQWMMKASAILELVQLEAPCASTLYRVGDRLYALREALMDGLYGNAQRLLGFGETLILYDLTNTFYTGRKKGALLAYGRSKEKRSDCPLVTLALMLDASGFVRGAAVLAGNASEPKTLQQAMERLNGARATVIMDAGIATRANVAYLRSKGLDWICVQRTQAPPPPERPPEECWNTQSGVSIKAWRLEQQQGTLQVYLHSEARKATGDRILNTRRAKFEAALKTLHEGLSKPRCVKEYDKVQRRLGRELERHKRVSYQYKIDVLRKKDSTHAKAVTFTHLSAFEQQTQASGGYILHTSHTDWSASQIARTYWKLADIERTFRSLKSELGMRPLYHSKDERIRTHIFLSVLAYQAVQLIRTKLKQYDLHSSWTTLQFELNRWHRITTVLPTDRRSCILLKKDADQGPLQRQIAMIMGLKPHNYTYKAHTKRP